MKLRVLDDYRNAERWNDYVGNHSRGNLYHLYDWCDVINQAYGHENYRIAVVDEDDSLHGVLSLVHIKHFLFGNTLFSIPFFDLGGPLADNAAAAEMLIAKAVEIAASRRIDSIELRNQATGALPSKADFGRFRPVARPSGQPPKVRMLLTLPESSKELMAGFKSKVRSQIRRPVKSGLVGVSGGLELIDDFYRVFAENMRDLGSPVHSKKFIRKTYQAFSDSARFFVVYQDKTPVSCALTVGCGGTLYNPWASSLKKTKKLSPNMLLYWTMLEYACDNGFSLFDFGRSTRGAGTYHFKKQWGALESELGWFSLSCKEEPVQPGRESKTFDMLISLWKLMPISCSRLLGPRVRMYIGL